MSENPEVEVAEIQTPPKCQTPPAAAPPRHIPNSAGTGRRNPTAIDNKRPSGREGADKLVGTPICELAGGIITVTRRASHSFHQASKSHIPAVWSRLFAGSVRMRKSIHFHGPPAPSRDGHDDQSCQIRKTTGTTGTTRGRDLQ
ncbi:hypothetical protein CPLU01_01457 [Colletotrichum plurivorum]|uniref:Uncharacterized protein n=1 Tax=Colletotrichum plurivorum TaxID=2175906 RepID=A0A8H6NNW7_9PEZI|nr:hypothetical protein CPLU01_01457 [Colletotrichum plurivorum]